MLKMVKNEEGYIFRSFFKAFKENFKQSTIIWIILLALGIICCLDYRLAGMMPETAGFVMRSFFLLIAFFLLSVSIYAFALTARYVNGIKATFRNALILTIAKLPYTLLMVVVTVGAVVVSLWNSVTLVFAIPLWLLIGGALIAWINSFLLRRVFLIFEDNSENDENNTEEEG